MVLFAQELEQSSGDSSWLYGIPNVWWGESPASEIHSQTWQVSARQQSLFWSFLLTSLITAPAAIGFGLSLSSFLRNLDYDKP